MSDLEQERLKNESKKSPGADDVAVRIEEILEKMSNKASDLLTWENELKARQDKLQKLSDDLGKKSAEADVLADMKQQLQQREKSLNERERLLEHDRDAAEHEYGERAARLQAQQQKKETEQQEAHKAIEARQADLLERENTVKDQENKLEETLALREAEHGQKLLAKEQESMAAFTSWAENKQQEYRKQLMQALGDHEKELAELRHGLYQESQQALAEKREELKALDEQREKDAKQLQDEKDKLEKGKQRYAIQLKQLTLRQDAIDEEIREGVKRQAADIKERLEQLENHNEQLLNDIRQKTATLNEMKQAMADFGDQPFAAMKKQLDDAEAENRQLKEALADSPARFDVEDYQALKKEKETLLGRIEAALEENRQLQDGQTNVSQLEFENERMTQQLSFLDAQFREVKEINQGLLEQVKRLSGAEQRAVERDERIKSIETWKVQENADQGGEEAVDRLKAPVTKEVPEEVDELEWLETIGKRCWDYGFKFPRRILYAFHTALKIADWSMITVLAGVSGTGKSELPHLYARFGGLNFISVPVQPNWDSQESMLGFFNSIDNKFDAQPLLRFLAQCSSRGQGMENSLSIVLLDEMNLVHVEHYFAEFLSKLELRRDYDDAHIPSIDINIGAGMEPYKLRLTRNILWTGTMNQDETTKSLSDKVIDRGIVIHFPRPKHLFGRQKTDGIDAFLQEHGQEVQMLDYRVWRDQWQRQPAFQDAQSKLLDSYRTEVIEKINDYLAEAGRALGHRVWQSIEYYIANYPLVIAAQRDCQPGECTEALKQAMHQAFEDQLVQKVMPKLRGIETSGPTRTKCLDKIQALLESQQFDLGTDFSRACSIGYGQFIWSSADYIDDSDIAGAASEDVADVADEVDEADGADGAVEAETGADATAKNAKDEA
ncbi:hypothetical protein [Mitsuokella jalaludinii]|uniref:hypothetical protein n=1 Tax=Mitsuokella jalaludinii TaxID=187979 RepID=UPI0022DFF4E6|nr:hypothetical protein [Mitsuokella jalaludinii]